MYSQLVRRTDRRQTDRLRDRQIDRQRVRKIQRQTDRQTNSQSARQTDRQTDGRTDGRANGRQTDWEIDRKTNRWTGGQKKDRRAMGLIIPWSEPLRSWALYLINAIKNVWTIHTKPQKYYKTQIIFALYPAVYIFLGFFPIRYQDGRWR